METPEPCPQPLPLPVNASAPSFALPWEAHRTSRSANRKRLTPAALMPILDRCVIALTIVTAASLVLGSYAKPSHSRELLPVMLVSSAD